MIVAHCIRCKVLQHVTIHHIIPVCYLQHFDNKHIYENHKVIMCNQCHKLFERIAFKAKCLLERLVYGYCNTDKSYQYFVSNHPSYQHLEVIKPGKIVSHVGKDKIANIFINLFRKYSFVHSDDLDVLMRAWHVKQK